MAGQNFSLLPDLWKKLEYAERERPFSHVWIIWTRRHPHRLRRGPTKKGAVFVVEWKFGTKSWQNFHRKSVAEFGNSSPKNSSFSLLKFPAILNSLNEDWHALLWKIEENAMKIKVGCLKKMQFRPKILTIEKIPFPRDAQFSCSFLVCLKLNSPLHALRRRYFLQCMHLCRTAQDEDEKSKRRDFIHGPKCLLFSCRCRLTEN